MILGIQTLRAVAAMMVLVVHSYPAFKAGPAGVDIFFVISGFVMAVSSLGLAPHVFAFRRIIRIVPLYWGATLCLLFFWTIPCEALVRSLLFIPVSFNGVPFPVLNVGWSLNVEMFLYFIISICLFLPNRFVLFGTLVVICFACIAGASEVLDPITSIYFGNPMMLEFGSGMVLGWLHMKGIKPKKIFTFAMVIIAITWIAVMPANNVFSFARVLSWGVPSVMLVLAAAQWKGTGSETVLKFAGDASYALYLTHPIVMLTGIRPLWLLVVTAIIVAAATNLLIERPLLRFLRGLAGWALSKRTSIKTHHATFL